MNYPVPNGDQANEAQGEADAVCPREKIRSHRDLRVWREAMDLAVEVQAASRAFPADERYSLIDQMRRSSRSVAANIAEAWRKRRYGPAFVAKLNDAEGEAAETQTHLELAVRYHYLSAENGGALDQRYERLLGQLVTMSARPEVWIIRQGKPTRSGPFR
jgi:four helix bundle protein